jgi:hypothetical protein
VSDSKLAVALVESIDDAALQRLAERLSPYTDRRTRALEDRWLSAKDAAAHLGISVHALHKLTAAREVPFEQDGPGCKLWFRRAELDRWRQRGGPAPRKSASTLLPQRSRAAS